MEQMAKNNIVKIFHIQILTTGTTKVHMLMCPEWFNLLTDYFYILQWVKRSLGSLLDSIKKTVHRPFQGHDVGV